MRSGVLLLLDDPLENIQLRKAQQNLQRPANTQGKKGQLQESGGNETSQPVTGDLIKGCPAHHSSHPLRLPFAHNTALKKK